ncbi:hypothetical protein L7F22_002491 [Adiantum nelumboides]|nr:hypothetical protein [Adiantum nelumboides]
MPPWKQGQPTPYSAMAQAFAEIEATTKRLAILEILTKLLVKVVKLSPEDLLPCVYLCINRLCPDYEGLELGIGESILVKSIAQSTGRDVARIKKDLEAKGDLGLVAIGSRQKQPTMFKSAALTVRSVFKQLKEIAAMAGNKSQERKIGGIKKLLAASQGEEPKYIMRSLEGKLLETVKSVYSELPSYDIVVPTLLRVGVEGLRTECKLTPACPSSRCLLSRQRQSAKSSTASRETVCVRVQIRRRAGSGALVPRRRRQEESDSLQSEFENMSVKYPTWWNRFHGQW